MAYNGWSNYETWNVKLWFDNDQSSYFENTNRAEELVADKGKGEEAIYELMSELKENFEENNPLADRADYYSDLLSAAISEINWYEIAEAYINEVEIEEEELEINAN